MSPLSSQRAIFVNNLLKVYRASSSTAKQNGVLWYPAARATVNGWASDYRLHVGTVAMVVAAISPQVAWEENLIIAGDILADRALTIAKALPVNIAKARRIREENTGKLDDMLRHFPYGPKVNSFAANLSGADSVVTVDTHALQAAFNDVTSKRTLKWSAYSVLAQAYAIAADKAGHTPANFQAIIWLAWKEKYSRVQKLAARK